MAENEQASAPAPQQAKRVEGEIHSASAIHLLGTGNDFTIIFQRQRPLTIQTEKGEQIAAAMPETTAMVAISPQTAKDLVILLGAAIEDYEKDFGKVETPFSRERQKS